MPPSEKPALGAGTAFLAYFGLMLGQFVIGASVQQRSIVAGLWVTEALAIALPALFVLLLAGVRLGPYLGFRGLTWKHALIAAVVSAANQPVVSFLTWFARAAVPQSWADDFDSKQRMLDAIFRMHAVPMVITVTLAAPLGEELFFRGFALPALQKSWGPAAAIFVSGALFSLLHVDKVGFIGLMEIGIVLAALRYWSGSLWAAILGHAVNNGIAGGAFLLGYEDPDVPPPPAMLAAGAVLLVVGIVLLVRVLRRPTATVAEDRHEPNRPLAAVLGVIWVAAFAWGLSQVVAQIAAMRARTG
jgi:membrane protease YdiL (CAAX protease family)